MHLRTETPVDWWEVEALYDLCFAPGREALSSYRLRKGIPPVEELCLVLRDDSWILVSAIRTWPVRIGTRKGKGRGARTLLLGPVAVHPTRQGEGLGGLIVHGALERARDIGWKRVMLVGDAPYYSRFGFRKLTGLDMPPPTNPDRVLGLDLVPGAWNGVSGPVRRWTGEMPGEEIDALADQ